jgi:TonB family protein
MRFYLVGATLLALTIPLLKLPKLFFSQKEPLITEVIAMNATTLTPAPAATSWPQLLLIGVYMVISAFLLAKLLSSLYFMFRLKRQSAYQQYNDLYLRKVRDLKGSFTFFHWIFLSEEIDENQQDYQAILKHEKAHASLGHTYDLLFFELFKVCFWWLPTSWLINKEIRKIHEYQADAYALKWCHIDRYSSILISSTLKSNGLSLASSFHDGLILKRLNAMKQQAKNVSPWKLAALSVLCTLLLIVFACTEDMDPQANEPTADGEVFSKVEEQPYPIGGMDVFYQYIGQEMKYPLQARRMGIEGKVFVEFVVEKDGSLSQVKALKGIGAGCDAEAVRVVQNAPHFNPGTQRGKPVRVKMTLPVIFKLNHGKTNPDNSTQGMIILEETQANLNKLKVNAGYANGAWSGTVYDEQGHGLPGANIMVSGTPAGTVSDLDGSFKIESDQADELYISFVGYETVKLAGK